MKAVVIGATGAVGHFIVSELCNKSKPWDEVVVLTRREYTDFDGLSEKYAVDRIRRVPFPSSGFEKSYEKLVPEVSSCDAMFITLGALPSKDGKAAVTLVDYKYVIAAGKLAKAAGIRHVSVLTATGANANSSSHYSKMKGMSEEALKELEIPQLQIYRAGALIGRKFSNSKGEVVVRNKGLFDVMVNSRLFKAIIPSKFRVECSDLAKVMVYNARFALENNEMAVTVYENTAIRDVLEQLSDN